MAATAPFSPFAVLGRPAQQFLHEIGDHGPHRVQLAEAERGQRDHGDPAAGRGAHHNRYALGMQRQVGQTDRDVPDLLFAAARHVVQQCLHSAVSARCDRAPPGPDLPAHLVIHPPGEQIGKLLGEPLRDPRRMIGWGSDQAHHDHR